MQAYAYDVTLDENGKVILDDLPLNAGDRVEIIVIPRPSQRVVATDASRYPFWGQPITYREPTEPVAEADWGILQ